MSAALPYFVPQDPGRWSAHALAAVVHLALFAFLWFGVRWQNNVPVTLEAEVWDMKTREAAPKPAMLPVPEPTPAIQPPAPAVSQPAPVPTLPEQPDIALEQERERKASRLKADEEKKATAAIRKKQAAELKILQKLAEEKKAKTRADEKLEKKKLLEQQKAKEAIEQKMRDKVHADDMKRLLGQAVESNSGGTGEAQKSTGARGDPNYASIIINKIKSNIIYGGDTEMLGNPRTTFKIEQLPTGEIISIKKIKASGIPAFDDAVEKAIAKSSPLPRKKDGTVERNIEAVFNLKEIP